MQEHDQKTKQLKTLHRPSRLDIVERHMEAVWRMAGSVALEVGPVLRADACGSGRTPGGGRGRSWSAAVRRGRSGGIAEVRVRSAAPAALPARGRGAAARAGRQALGRVPARDRPDADTPVINAIPGTAA